MTVKPNIQVINVDSLNMEKKENSPKTIAIMLKSIQWRALLSEFVSTTLLLFLGCMTCIPVTGLEIHPPMYAPIGFGLVVLFIITSFGHISGAHMNPTVTLAAMFYGKMSIPLGVGYCIAQILGAIVGYGMLISVSPIDLISGSICVNQPHPDQVAYQALIIEIILSASLGFLCCAIWDPVNENKNDGIPMKFGFTVAALSLAGGPLTGASMNPAKILATALWTGNWNTHWIYWVGPIVGGCFAAIFYKLIWFQGNTLKQTEKNS